jgi:hypothetical protein
MIVKRILSAAWFERAWCDHEMRLAQEHVFLVPYKRPCSSEPHGFVRFTGRIFRNFLQHVIFTDLAQPRSHMPELVKAVCLSAFFSEHEIVTIKRQRQNGHFRHRKVGLQHQLDITGPQLNKY